MNSHWKQVQDKENILQRFYTLWNENTGKFLPFYSICPSFCPVNSLKMYRRGSFGYFL